MTLTRWQDMSHLWVNGTAATTERLGSSVCDFTPPDNNTHHLGLIWVCQNSRLKANRLNDLQTSVKTIWNGHTG